MTLNLQKFYQACNPSKTLDLGNPQDQQYYIDFSSVRGEKIIQQLKRTITILSPNQPSCQLFTGHIGCGKSTELLRLKAELEQDGFHVVYFESTQDLEMIDIDISDILLAIVRQVSASLEAFKINLKPGYFANLFTEFPAFVQTPIQFKPEEKLSIEIGKIIAKSKESPKLRHLLREYLEPRTASILESLNKELLEPAITQLKQLGKKGLVVIVDNLDRVDSRYLSSGRSQPEYIFIDRGEQLRKLNCHLVFTVPLALIFSNDREALKNRLGGGLTPKVLPMVPVRLRDGTDCHEGIALLRQMVLARAFPDLNLAQKLELVTEIFDTPETCDRLCRVSGGHLRNLLGLLYRCLQQEDPPFSRNCLESVIRQDSDRWLLAITDHEWELLFQVMQKQTITGQEEYQTLLQNMLAFEYRYQQDYWFSINPILAETEKFKSWKQAN